MIIRRCGDRNDDDSITIDNDLVVLSISEVDSTHTTHDVYEITRELEEGEVVETRDVEITGSFETVASRLSTTTTDTVGVSHYEEHPSGSFPGPITNIEMEANDAFSDHRETSNAMSGTQSGSYGDGETASSSTTMSVTSVDEYFSDSAGDYYWDGGTGPNDVMEGSYTSHEEGSSERSFTEGQSFTPEGNSASWSTSFERERSWEVHTEGETYGYATIFEDSGSESYSESSGSQSYTPTDDDNPSNGYDGDYGTHEGGEGGGGGSGEGGQSNEERLNTAVAFLKRFMTQQGGYGRGHLEKLPYFVNPGEDIGPTTTKLIMTDRMLEEGRRNGFWTLAVAGEDDKATGDKGWFENLRWFLFGPEAIEAHKTIQEHLRNTGDNYLLYLNPWNPNIPPEVDGLDTFLRGAQKTSIVVAGSAIGGVVIISGGAAVGIPGLAALGATKLTVAGVAYFVAMETGELIIESATGIPIILSPEDVVEWVAKGLLKKGTKEGTYALTKAGLKHADELAEKAAKEAKELAEKTAKEAKEAAERAAKEAKEAAEKAEKAAKEAAERAKEAAEKGKAGEKAAGIAKNTQRIDSLSGKAAYRIPDELTETTLTEVKNVAYQHFSTQLQDSLHYAIMTGRQMILKVRPDTILSKELQDAIKAGWIKLEFIP